MSKSKKNVIDPNALLDRFGADTTRLFCLFAAPPEKDLEWSEQGVEGGYRFLNRVWRYAATRMERLQGVSPFDGDPSELDPLLSALWRATHRTIRRVTRDIEERFHFNTAISAVMELVNTLHGLDPRIEAQPAAAGVLRLALESVVLLLAPIVPHFAEALWNALGRAESVLLAPWPVFREDALDQREMLIVVQVNGKLRGRVTVAADAGEEEIFSAALEDENVRRCMAGQTPRKKHYVPNKLVSFVI